MGLDLSVNEKHVVRWSYSGFHSFRVKIAASIDIDLNKMEGFNDVAKEVIKEEGWENYQKLLEEDQLKEKISWESIDPKYKELVPFLSHSDCDGEISSELCEGIAKHLENISATWSDTVILRSEPSYLPMQEMFNYDKTQVKKLIKGLKEAALTGNPLIFS